MRRLMIFCGVLAFDVTSSFADQLRREPWRWTVEERIAARSDHSAARARVESARAQGHAPTTIQNGRVTPIEIADQIRGEQSPHLFLPTEVFESVVRNTFVLEGWREMFVDKASDAGLPPTFWEQLEELCAVYIEDLREEDRIAKLQDPVAVMALRQALHLRLCANRAEALAKARERFGPSLEIFMYRDVAPTKSLITDTVPDRAKLKSREQGCR